jgi:hypothetical protein
MRTTFIISRAFRATVLITGSLGALVRAEESRAPLLLPELSVEEKAAIQATDAEALAALAQTPVQNYPITPEGQVSLRADLERFKKEAQRLGVYPRDEAFDLAWAANADRFTSAQSRAILNSVPLNQMGLAIFGAAEADMSRAIDAADPVLAAQRRQVGMPTPGEQREQEDAHRHESWTAKAALTAVGGAAAGGAYFLLRKMGDTFFFGPMTSLTNALTGPVMNPIQEKVAQTVNRHITPRFAPWAQFIQGEKRRQKRAVKEAERRQRKGLPPVEVKPASPSSDVGKYTHPSVSSEQWMDDFNNFYDQAIKAQAQHMGVLPAQFLNARNTIMELIYYQPRWFSEQLNAFSNTLTISADRSERLAERLVKAGASESEVARFSQLVASKQDIMVFEDVHSAKLPAIEKEITGLMDFWIKERKLPTHLLGQFYQGELNLLTAQNRQAFALASILDTERFFPEYNKAIGNLPLLQAWQEQGREMTGIYDALRANKVKIEKYFLKRGITYDVMARINERGYPFGGPSRPVDLPPRRDVVMDSLDRAEGVDPDEHVSKRQPELEPRDNMGNVKGAPALVPFHADASPATAVKGPACASLWGRLSSLIRL